MTSWRPDGLSGPWVASGMACAKKRALDKFLNLYPTVRALGAEDEGRGLLLCTWNQSLLRQEAMSSHRGRPTHFQRQTKFRARTDPCLDMLWRGLALRIGEVFTHPSPSLPCRGHLPGWWPSRKKRARGRQCDVLHPKDVQTQVPGTCECAWLHGKGELRLLTS